MIFNKTTIVALLCLASVGDSAPYSKGPARQYLRNKAFNKATKSGHRGGRELRPNLTDAFPGAGRGSNDFGDGFLDVSSAQPEPMRRPDLTDAFPRAGRASYAFGDEDNASSDLKAKDAKAKDNKEKDGKEKDGKAKDGKAKDDKAKGDKAKDDKAKDAKAKDADAKEKDDKAKDGKAKDGKAKDDKAKGDKAKDAKSEEGRERRPNLTDAFPGAGRGSNDFGDGFIDVSSAQTKSIRRPDLTDAFPGAGRGSNGFGDNGGLIFSQSDP